MLTFPPPAVKAVSIIPLNSDETGGRFRVWLFLVETAPILVWDRKVEGGFPELKVLVCSSWVYYYSDDDRLHPETTDTRSRTTRKVAGSFRQEIAPVPLKSNASDDTR